MPSLVLILFSSLFIVSLCDFSVPKPNAKADSELETNRIPLNSTNAGAICRDANIANYINTAMQSYIHNMEGLAKSILDQIVMFRKPGKWLVHAQVIATSRQGPEWQTTTNGDVFSHQNPFACYYHDQQTYILVIRLY